MKENSTIAAYILCGGKSSRMKTDKGLVLWEEKPFVQHIAETITPLTEAIVLVTDNAAYAQFGYPLIPDIYPDKGPLGGIHTALSHSKAATNLILSCDIPLILTTILSEILAVHANSEEKITIAATKESLHPLIGVYEKNLTPLIEKHIAEGKLKLLDFVAQIPHQTVVFEDDLALENINSQKELDALNPGLLEVNVKYFGVIAEITGKPEETLELAAPSLAQLLRDLKDTYHFGDTPLNIAINKEVVHISEERELKPTDEIAILPPFAGG